MFARHFSHLHKLIRVAPTSRDAIRTKAGTRFVPVLQKLREALRARLRFAVAGLVFCFCMSALSVEAQTWTTESPELTARSGAAAAGIDGKLYVVGGTDTGGNLLSTLEVYDPASGTWTTKASMPTARTGAAAAGIDGKLYVVGGNNGSNLATLEVYDPAADSWSTPSPMSAGRSFLAAAATDGKLYAVGGAGDSGPLATLEIYDSASDTWTSAVSMPTAREALGAAVIDGKLYAVGGVTGSGTDLAVLEVYDTAASTWTAQASMPTARQGLAAAAVDGHLYAVGGTNGGNLSTLEIYDPGSDMWGTEISMPTSRQFLAAAALDGQLYAAGGIGNSGVVSALEVYATPQTRTWQAKSSMATARVTFGAGAIDGNLYAVGGFLLDGSRSPALEEYNPPTDTWTTKASIPTPRDTMPAVAIDGKLYVPGGIDNTQDIVSTLEVYDPASDTWATKTSMPTARAYTGGAEIDGKLYVVGGVSPVTPLLTTLEVYDPITDTWTTKASMATARLGLSAAAIDGKLYAVGGSNALNGGGGGVLSTLEVYDPGSDTWATKTSMPTARSLLSAVAIDGKLYASGGDTGTGGGPLSTVEIYDPATDTWTTATSMSTARDALGGAGIDGQLYALGGINTGFLSTMEAFDLPPVATPSAFTSPDNATFIAGAPGSFTVTATGFPTPTLSVSGTLPAGVTFNATTAATGVLSGTVTAVGSYDFFLIASNGPPPGTVQSFTLNVLGLQSIAVTPVNPTEGKGLTQQFTATGTFSDSSTLDITGSVTWTSSKTAVATITSGGLATVIGRQGSTTITATLGAISGATVFTAAAPVLESIQVTPATPTILTGATQKFVATGTYSDGSTKNITTSVTWTSSNLSAAPISGAGVATGANPGSSTISAVLVPIIGSTTLTVQPALVSIDIAPVNPSLNVGLSLQFTATGIYSDSSTQDVTADVAWTSSKPAVATISATGGLAAAVKGGTTTIKAKLGAIAGTTSLTSVPVLTSIQVTPAAPTILAGATQKFTATGTFNDGSTKNLTASVTWTSSNPSVATISGALATGVSPGGSTITASTGPISGMTTLTVQPTLTSITIAPVNPTLSAGLNLQFTATGMYSDSSTQDLTSVVAWTSSKPAVATIGAAGLATSVAKGNTTIKAKSGGVTGTTTLAVTP